MLLAVGYFCHRMTMLKLYLQFPVIIITAFIAANIDASEVSEDDTDDQSELNTCGSQGIVISSYLCILNVVLSFLQWHSLLLAGRLYSVKHLPGYQKFHLS